MRRPLGTHRQQHLVSPDNAKDAKEHNGRKSLQPCGHGLWYSRPLLHRSVLVFVASLVVPLMLLSLSREGHGGYAIMGGTGMQGGSAIEYLLRVGVKPSRIKILTRNASSSEARELSSKRIEVIEGKNEAASWKKLLDGVENVFAITFTDFEDSSGEVRRGRELFDLIVKSNTIRRVVFSGGERTAVPSLNAKADIEDFARTLLVGSSIQCTFLHTSFFLENVLYKGKHKRYQKLENGQYRLSLPLPFERKIPMISARDIGFIAGRILESKPFAETSSLAIVGDLVSPQYFLEVLKESIPQHSFTYVQTDPETLRSALGEAQASVVMEMYNSFYKMNSNETLTAEIKSPTRKLYADTMSAKTWVNRYARRVLEEE